MKLLLSGLAGFVLGVVAVFGTVYIYVESQGGAGAMMERAVQERVGSMGTDALKDKLGDKLPLDTQKGVPGLDTLPKF